MASSLSLPVVPLEGGLSQYFREVWKFPILEKEVELDLARQWRENGDTEAAHKLVTSHLRLVAKIAMKYRGYGLPMADLVSEGSIGLMKAVKKFEPERGFRLSTYAIWWIKASITEYILRSWSMVKMGTVTAQKKLFFSLRRHKNRLKIFDTGDLKPEDTKRLSEELNISQRDIVDMNRRLAARDLSLNAPLSVGEDENLEFQDTLEDDGPSPEHLLANNEEFSYRRSLLFEALETLSERERHIFTERRLKDDPVTLETLGEHYGISRERIRQLEVRAFEKVRQAMMEAIDPATLAVT